MALPPAPLPHLASLLEAGAVTANASAPLPWLVALFDSSNTATKLSFATTLNAAGLAHGYRLAGATIAFTETLNAATLTKGSSLASVDNPAPLPHMSGVMAVASGARVLAGGTIACTATVRDANLRKGYTLAAQTLGIQASIPPGYSDFEMTGARLTFAVALQNANLGAAPRTLTASTMTYTCTLNPATLTKEAPGARVLVANPITFTVNLRDATLRRTAVLQASPLAFSVSIKNADNGGTATFTPWSPRGAATSNWTPRTPAVTSWESS